MLVPALHVSSGGSDTTGDGTQTAPFATLQKAFDTIKTRNDSTASYIIRVSGTVVGGCTVDSTQAAGVLIIGTGADTDILDGNGATHVFKTFSAFPVEFRNIKMTNASYSTMLSVNNSDATVTFGSGAEMYGITHTGVDASSGTFILDGGAILDNADEYGPNGKTVDFSGKKFIMKSGIIRGRKNSKGGCVFINGGEFVMEGGTISGGTATTYGGGGVYINSSTFTMTGGEISGNTSSVNGGGVFVRSGATFNMSGGKITGNQAAASGGGVYVESGGTYTNTGGTVSGNSPDDVYSEP